MTLLDNTITGRASSSHCGPLKLQIQIAKVRSKKSLKKIQNNTVLSNIYNVMSCSMHKFKS